MFSKFYRFKLNYESTVKMQSTCVLPFFMKLREYNSSTLITLTRGEDTTLEIIKTLPKGDYMIEVGMSSVLDNPFPNGVPTEFEENAYWWVSGGLTAQPYTGQAYSFQKTIYTKPVFDTNMYVEFNIGYQSYTSNLAWFVGAVWGSQTPFLSGGSAIEGSNNHSSLSYEDDGIWGNTEYYHKGGGVKSNAPSYDFNNTIRMAVNPTTKKMWFGEVTYNGGSSWYQGNPATGSSAPITVTSNAYSEFRIFISQAGYNSDFVVPFTINNNVPVSRVPTGFNPTFTTLENTPVDDPFSLYYEVIG